MNSSELEYERARDLLDSEDFWNSLQLSTLQIIDATEVSMLCEVSNFVSKQMEVRLCATLNKLAYPNCHWSIQSNRFPDLMLTYGEEKTGYGIEIKASFLHAKEASSRFWESANALERGKTTILVIFWCLDTCNGDFCQGSLRVYGHSVYDAFELAIRRGELHHKPEEGRIIKEPVPSISQRRSAVRALVVDEKQKQALLIIVNEFRKMTPRDHAHTSSEQALVNAIMKQFTFTQDTNCGKIDRILGHGAIGKIRQAHVKETEK